jgi:hypothetical protein
LVAEPGEEAGQSVSMSETMRWSPRALGIAYVLFLGLFALDVFQEGLGVIETILALFMHLLPAFLVLLALVVAWRWPGSGGLLFILLAVGLLFLIAGPGPFRMLRMTPLVYLIVAGPLYLVGGLFLLSSRFSVDSRGRARNRRLTKRPDA